MRAPMSLASASSGWEGRPGERAPLRWRDRGEDPTRDRSEDARAGRQFYSGFEALLLGRPRAGLGDASAGGCAARACRPLAPSPILCAIARRCSE